MNQTNNKMKIASLLHFYQPHNQQKDILDRIVHESYLPILNTLLEHPEAKIIVNINGALTRLLDQEGFGEVIELFKTLAKRGQIEFTGSAMYHAFLPLLPEEEIERQIKLNDEINGQYFGDLYQPVGFFSPEMAINDKVLSVVADLGFKWVSCPQVSYGSDDLVPNTLFKDAKSDLNVFFRNKRVSVLILSAVARDAADLLKQTQDLMDVEDYWFTVMDAETFGHHRVGHVTILDDIFDSDQLETCTASDLLDIDLPVEDVNLRASTWTNEEQDFWLDKGQTKATEARSFVLWQDPTNPIHKLQWGFVDFVLDAVTSYEDKDSEIWKETREKLDYALASDQFWWASTNPWWSLEMIEQGAFMLKDVIFTLFSAEKESEKAEEFYRAILDQAFEWQRNGYIREKHLENSSTYMQKPFKERTPAEWHNQMVLEFEDQMKKAAEERKFEEAVKWRDALIKIQQGSDIYDVLHVVDELWSARNIPSVKPFLTHEWEEFSEFAKQNFLDASSKEEFEKWKKSKR